MLYLLTVHFTMLSVSSLHTIKRQNGQRMNCRESEESVHGLYKHGAEKNQKISMACVPVVSKSTQVQRLTAQ